MKVKELIEALKKYSPDEEVLIRSDGFDFEIDCVYRYQNNPIMIYTGDEIVPSEED